MSSLRPVGRSGAAHQNDRASLCRFTFSDGCNCRYPRHNSFKINTYKIPGEGYKNLGWSPATCHQSPVTNHVPRFLSARTSVRSKSSCVSRRRMSFVRVPSISTSLARVRAL